MAIAMGLKKQSPDQETNKNVASKSSPKIGITLPNVKRPSMPVNTVRPVQQTFATDSEDRQKAPLQQTVNASLQQTVNASSQQTVETPLQQTVTPLQQTIKTPKELKKNEELKKIRELQAQMIRNREETRKKVCSMYLFLL